MMRGKGIYDALPVWAQTWAVNWQSRQNYQARYGGVFQHRLTRLAANERKSRDQLLTEQAQAVATLKEYAQRRVPFYQQQDGWPVLDKQTVATQPEQFLSEEYRPASLLTAHTSGTTGSPLVVRFTKSCHQTEMAFRWRHRAWAGVPFLSSSAYISGHAVVPPTQMVPPFWRWDKIEQRLLMSSYHLTPANLPAYAAALAEYRPEFVHGYPSSLYLLAGSVLAGAAGLANGWRPRAVFTASETLLDFQRTAIEQAFGAKVFNWYGNTEMTANIVECAAGNLHYRTDYGLIELLEDGTMVLTGLNNWAMPLIRYRVGDVARWRAGDCACGMAFPMVERVEGRQEDYVRTPDGRRVGRLDHLFKDVRHVREAQIVQKRVDEIVCRVVRTAGFEAADEERVRQEARQRLGDGVAVRFEFVEQIERTKNGKFRFIVSEL